MTEVEQIKQQLLSLKESLKDLSNSSLDVRNSFSESHRLLDQAVKKLQEQKKTCRACAKEIRSLKQTGKDTKQFEEVMDKEIEPVIQDLNQRLVPLTGRLNTLQPFLFSHPKTNVNFQSFCKIILRKSKCKSIQRRRKSKTKTRI